MRTLIKVQKKVCLYDGNFFKATNLKTGEHMFCHLDNDKDKHYIYENSNQVIMVDILDKDIIGDYTVKAVRE